MLAVFVVLGVSAWYGQNTLRSYFVGAEKPEPTITEEPAVPEGEPITEAPVKLPEDILRERAFAVAHRPIYVNAKLSPSVEKSARDKITEVVNMIQDNYDYDSPWLELAGYRKLIGDYEGAIQAWLFLSEIRPNSFVPLHNIGELYAFTLRNPFKGEQYLLGSLEVSQSNTQGYLALANLYGSAKELGKQDQVDDILIGGLAANPTDTLLMTTLAAYYRDKGERDLALSYYRRALELFPDSASLKQEIAALEAR